MESYDILVIALAITLLISLVIWIVCGVLVIKILKKIKLVTETAQSAAENVESFTSQLKSAGKLTTAGTFFTQLLNIFKRSK